MMMVVADGVAGDGDNWRRGIVADGTDEGWWIWIMMIGEDWADGAFEDSGEYAGWLMVIRINLGTSEADEDHEYKGWL